MDIPLNPITHHQQWYYVVTPTYKLNYSTLY